jgi:deoxyribose-phosphate aldolase
MSKLASTLERTVLHPTLRIEVLEKAIQEAIQFKLAGLCVPPFWVKRAKRDLGLQPVILSTVVGFPFGYQRTETKLAEIETALQDGATDLQVSMNTSALFSPSSSWIKIELAKCATAVHARQATLTVIIEGALLEEEQVQTCCKVSADAGADFVKNASGFLTGSLLSASLVQQISLFRRFLPADVSIKACGKIHSHSEATQLLRAGAEQICIDGPVHRLLPGSRNPS